MTDPHADRPIETLGPAPTDSAGALVLVHGRGATARGILGLARDVAPPDLAVLAPQAANNTWYPQSFLAPVSENEPHLSSALARLGSIRADLTAAGLSSESIMFIGFSQGACLASEFVARNPMEYGGLAALSGGLIGPLGMAFAYEGSLAGTPVFLGCSDVDPHIPLERVEETADVFRTMDAQVRTEIYEGMGHGINEDEMRIVSDMAQYLSGDS